MKIPQDMIPGTVHITNKCGYLEILEYKKRIDVIIKFLNTGYVASVSSRHIRSGIVKDKLFPSVAGIGYIGDGDHKSSVNGKPTKCYSTWQCMIYRCYSERVTLLNPTYASVSVCNSWHNYQTFADWFQSKYKSGLQIDKDIKVKGNKIYSPNTCMLVTVKDNTVKAHAKNYSFESPSGEVVNIYNLNSFCDNNNLNHGCMSAVHFGNRNHHKGWRKA